MSQPPEDLSEIQPRRPATPSRAQTPQRPNTPRHVGAFRPSEIPRRATSRNGQGVNVGESSYRNPSFRSASRDKPVIPAPQSPGPSYDARGGWVNQGTDAEWGDIPPLTVRGANVVDAPAVVASSRREVIGGVSSGVGGSTRQEEAYKTGWASAVNTDIEPHYLPPVVKSSSNRRRQRRTSPITVLRCVIACSRRRHMSSRSMRP